MANHYLNFSEVIDHLRDDEADWLRQQLQVVHVFGETEYAAGEVPEHLASETADWIGCRAYRDMEAYDPDCGEPVGFEYRFSEDDTDETWGRYLWLYAEEWGDVERVAHLVRTFLNRFRPDACWALTYAAVCSQPRVSEFGGGAVFVTADEIRYHNAHEFVEQCRAQ